MAAIETASKIGLISKALVLCGEQPLNSLSDSRYGATVGGSLYEQLYEAELQSNRWRFSCAKVALSQLVDVPLNEFKHAYQLPSAMLLPLGTYPASRYEIYGDHLYTNQSSVELEHQFKPDISECPAYFTLLLTYALFRDLVGPITESTAKMQVAAQLYNVQRSRAMFADAQGRSNRPIADSPFTAGR
ncbi:MAG: hypothetical protein ACREXP_03800 [Steroidobacteraceae bacterium]